MKTNKIKKVLIALDYDETSQKVAKAGLSLAKTLNAEIILLHVISEQPVYYSAYSYMVEYKVEFVEDLKISIQKFLEKAKNHMGDESIKTILKEGEVAETILKTAKELNVDVIVMGSHSRKWLDDIVMGSAAKDVLKKTTVPLFIVPTKKQVE